MLIVGNDRKQYVYELLTSYPTPQKIKGARFDSLLKIKWLTASKVNEIGEAAHFTIDTSSPALQLEHKQLILTIRHFDEQIEEI